MLFHYVSGALMSEIAIEGLTSEQKQRRFDYVDPWEGDMSSPDDPEDYYSTSFYYGGYRHFVAESMSRKAAQMIATALGGYLVDDSYINVGRQLGDGGPFVVHKFYLYNPVFIAVYQKLQWAIDRANRELGQRSSSTFLEPSRDWFRIYDSSGYMVMEIKR